MPHNYCVQIYMHTSLKVLNTEFFTVTSGTEEMTTMYVLIYIQILKLHIEHFIRIYTVLYTYGESYCPIASLCIYVVQFIVGDKLHCKT